MKQYKDYMNRISMDSEMYETITNNVIHKSKKQRKKTGYRAIGLVAAVAMCMLCVFIVPKKVNTGDKDGSQSKEIKQENAISGLPVNNFSLPDGNGESFGIADRVVFEELPDLMRWPGMSVFAYVKVLDINHSNTEESAKRQDADVKVLSVLGDKKTEKLDCLTVTQAIHGGCMGLEETNLLRKGGVYLLPLVKSEDKWEILGDLDVLFEVDDKGCIWSHSRYEKFAQYNGAEYRVVTEKINELLAKKE